MDIDCIYRGTIKTLMSLPTREGQTTYDDFHIIKSACTHDSYVLNGTAAIIENIMVCIDCKLRK